jgi:hypothetical protein
MIPGRIAAYRLVAGVTRSAPATLFPGMQNVKNKGCSTLLCSAIFSVVAPPEFGHFVAF